MFGARAGGNEGISCAPGRQGEHMIGQSSPLGGFRQPANLLSGRPGQEHIAEACLLQGRSCVGSKRARHHEHLQSVGHPVPDRRDLRQQLPRGLRLTVRFDREEPEPLPVDVDGCESDAARSGRCRISLPWLRPGEIGPLPGQKGYLPRSAAAGMRLRKSRADQDLVVGRLERLRELLASLPIPDLLQENDIRGQLLQHCCRFGKAQLVGRACILEAGVHRLQIPGGHAQRIREALSGRQAKRHRQPPCRTEDYETTRQHAYSAVIAIRNGAGPAMHET